MEQQQELHFSSLTSTQATLNTPPSTLYTLPPIHSPPLVFLPPLPIGPPASLAEFRWNPPDGSRMEPPAPPHGMGTPPNRMASGAKSSSSGQGWVSRVALVSSPRRRV